MISVCDGINKAVDALYITHRIFCHFVKMMQVLTLSVILVAAAVSTVSSDQGIYKVCFLTIHSILL